MPSAAQLHDQVENLARLAHAERGGRLVEDDDLAGEHGCARDGDRLPLAAGHEGDRRIEFRQLDLESFENRGGLALHGAGVEEPQTLRQPGGDGNLTAAIEVLGRRQIVEKREVLVDGLDAGAARSGRRRDRYSLAVEEDLAFVEGVDAADALDQRRLASTIVAEQGQHFAAICLEVYILQRMHRAKALLRVTDGENRDTRRHCVLAACSARVRASR